MPTFPTLSKNPDKESWEEGPLYDPTSRMGMTGGAQESRPDTTVVPWFWSFNYRQLSNADMQLVKNFEKNTVRYSGEFDWTNPFDSQTYKVTFGQKVQYRLENTQQNEWQLAILLIEANPTSD
jgi:hypothetical protein